MRRALLLLFVLATAALVPGCAAGRFITGSFGSLMRSAEPVPNKITHPARPDARLAVLWVGHATTLLQIDDKFILTDPVFTSTVGEMSKRIVEPGLDVHDVPAVDVTLISHMHFDHLSLGSLDMLEDKIHHLIVPQGGLVYIPNYAFEASELGTWRSWEEGGLRVTAVPVQHVGFRYGADAAWMTKSFTGYVIEYHGLSVYFSGDTGYSAEDFCSTSDRFPHLDLALIAIAPIEPRALMEHNHVDPKEAVQAFLDLRARWMVPIHHDTFFNSFDAPGQEVAALQQAMKDRGLTSEQVAILAIGEQRVFVKR
jgi:N-acyl-phosphatidylethanolamine-hydrolysing phospholipase D